jgi:hypothetical protein
MPNFTQTRLGDIKITADNEHLLRSGYNSRRAEELAVLERWFPKESVEVPVAKYLDIILYSREQVLKENAAMASTFSIGMSSCGHGHNCTQVAPLDYRVVQSVILIEWMMHCNAIRRGMGDCIDQGARCAIRNANESNHCHAKRSWYVTFRHAMLGVLLITLH